MRVVDITNPSQSLMVIKPTCPPSTAPATKGDYPATYNGG